MKTTLVIIMIVLLLVLIGILLVGLEVLLATGLGWLLSRFLPFTLYEAALLSLLGWGGLICFLVLLSRLQIPLHVSDSEDEGEDEEDEEEEEDQEEEEFIPSIPRWRQPLKRADRFAHVNPDDRCPCGSGRKYKNCHGRGKV